MQGDEIELILEDSDAVHSFVELRAVPLVRDLILNSKLR